MHLFVWRQNPDSHFHKKFGNDQKIPCFPLGYPTWIPFQACMPGIFRNDWTIFTVGTSRFQTFHEDDFVRFSLHVITGKPKFVYNNFRRTQSPQRSWHHLKLNQIRWDPAWSNKLHRFSSKALSSLEILCKNFNKNEIKVQTSAKKHFLAISLWLHWRKIPKTIWKGQLEIIGIIHVPLKTKLILLT